MYTNLRPYYSTFGQGKGGMDTTYAEYAFYSKRDNAGNNKFTGTGIAQSGSRVGDVAAIMYDLENPKNSELIVAGSADIPPETYSRPMLVVEWILGTLYFSLAALIFYLSRKITAYSRHKN